MGNKSQTVSLRSPYWTSSSRFRPNGLLTVSRFFFVVAKCGGTRHAYRGTISSPNYPGGYEPNMDCEYRIIVDLNRQVRLSFDTLNLRRWYSSIFTGNETNNAVRDDSLSIYDVDPFTDNSKRFQHIPQQLPLPSNGSPLPWIPYYPSTLLINTILSGNGRFISIITIG